MMKTLCGVNLRDVACLAHEHGLEEEEVFIECWKALSKFADASEVHPSLYEVAERAMLDNRTKFTSLFISLVEDGRRGKGVALCNDRPETWLTIEELLRAGL